MNTTIATYYISEIDNWKEAINLHFEEMNKTDEWLKEVLQYDTVPQLAAKVEQHLNQVMICRQQFDDLDDDIGSLEKKLLKDNIPISKEAISADLQKQQNDLRIAIFKAEKRLLEVKYECNQFLADIMAVQK